MEIASTRAVMERWRREGGCSWIFGVKTSVYMTIICICAAVNNRGSMGASVSSACSRARRMIKEREGEEREALLPHLLLQISSNRSQGCFSFMTLSCSYNYTKQTWEMTQHLAGRVSLVLSLVQLSLGSVSIGCFFCTFGVTTDL